MCLGLGARGANVSRQVITRRELEKHSTVKDSWVAIKGRVYDVSGFGKLHPGETYLSFRKEREYGKSGLKYLMDRD